MLLSLSLVLILGIIMVPGIRTTTFKNIVNVV